MQVECGFEPGEGWGLGEDRTADGEGGVIGG